MGILKYKIGDMFDSTDQVIGHGCNAQGVMGSGVARIMKKKFPEVYKEYAVFCAEKNNEVLGQVNLVVPCNRKHKWVANMITQDNFGTGLQVDYSAIYDTFGDLFIYMHHMGFTTLTIPKIGAGLGGGDWRVIEAIIDQLVEDYDIIVTVYELEESA